MADVLGSIFFRLLYLLLSGIPSQLLEKKVEVPAVKYVGS